MEEKRKKSKLLLIAIIVALVLLVGYSLISLIYYTSNSYSEKLYMKNWYPSVESGKVTEEEARNFFNELKKLGNEQHLKGYMKITGVGLLILAIPTLLTIIGERKNKRKMVLAAGIVYIFTIIGIPSAVLCFIANAKMKKLE